MRQAFQTAAPTALRIILKEANFAVWQVEENLGHLQFRESKERNKDKYIAVSRRPPPAD